MQDRKADCAAWGLQQRPSSQPSTPRAAARAAVQAPRRPGHARSRSDSGAFQPDSPPRRSLPAPGESGAEALGADTPAERAGTAAAVRPVCYTCICPCAPAMLDVCTPLQGTWSLLCILHHCLHWRGVTKTASLDQSVGLHRVIPVVVYIVYRHVVRECSSETPDECFDAQKYIYMVNSAWQAL